MTGTRSDSASETAAAGIGGPDRTLAPDEIVEFVAAQFGALDLDGRSLCLLVPDGSRSCAAPAPTTRSTASGTASPSRSPRGIPEEQVRAANLDHLDPATIDVDSWAADPDTLVVPDAGEDLYRLR